MLQGIGLPELLIILLCGCLGSAVVVGGVVFFIVRQNRQGEAE